jgi:lipase chaperone LimK
MSELKTSYELALERMKGMGIDDTLSLTDEQKQRIAHIKRECEAKVAENKILMQGAPELPEEIRRLEQRRDEKIEEIYWEARQNK